MYLPSRHISASDDDHSYSSKMYLLVFKTQHETIYELSKVESFMQTAVVQMIFHNNISIKVLWSVKTIRNMSKNMTAVVAKA